jgi:hypothetical protein
VRSKYPLQVLKDVREQQADVAAAELALAVRAREQAEQGLRTREHDECRHADEVLAVHENEQLRLAARGIRIADLAMADAFDVRATEQAAVLALAREESAAKCAVQQVEEAQARAELAAKQAALQVIEQDQDKWRAEAARVVQAVEEEDALEAFTGRRRT